MTQGSHTADFTIEGLADLLTTFLDAGYQFIGFDDQVEPHAAKVILRHDIDVDLDAALDVARLENELRIHATFFVLTTSDLYNIRSTGGRQVLREIHDLGHSIGLHFDASLYGDCDADEMAAHLAHDVHVLERLTVHPVKVFSLHKPGARTDVLVHAPDLISAYEPRFFSEIAYVSDSMGWWRYGRPTGLDAFRNLNAMQMVLHPVWWTSHKSEHPADRLIRLAESRLHSATRALASAVSPFAHWLAGNHSASPRWPDDVRAGDAGD